MSQCICPTIDKDLYKQLERMWVGDKTWDLLKLQDMYNAGNSLEDILKVVPFRNNECTRTSKCCGVCTRRCHSRCIQDCLNRLYMWRRLVESTPEDKRENIPLAIRMIVKQDFETLYDLSWCVGEIISRNTNTEVYKYMVENNMFRQHNPYKIDYAPRYDVDPRTGKRLIEPNTGRIRLLEWPASGLCPFCLPNVTIDRRKYKHDVVSDAYRTKEAVWW